MYHQIKEKKFTFSKIFSKVWEWSLIVCISIVILNSKFYLIDFPKPSIYLAITGSLMKHFWGIFMSFFIFGFAVLKISQRKYISGVVNHKTFHLFGKISYAVFMCHYVILKIFMAEISYQPIYITKISLVR
jgi:peptidoglycan/LPS O-acetylase OafA/YrhL